jgi:pyruvate,water dikinase
MYIINLDSAEPGTPGIGQKASGLAALIRAGFAVPKGFVVTSEAFEKFLTDTGISLEVPLIIGNVNPDEPKSAFEASRRIRELFFRTSGNDFLIKELRDAYSELSFGKDVSVAGGAVLGLVRAGRTDNFVSVRPSLICHKEINCAFPGHGKAVLNQIAYKQILGAVKECWLSVFSPEAIIYRKIHDVVSFSLAVVVQKMVDSELSGKIFTSEPVSGQKDKVLVEGFWGLGETHCCGCLTPDQFLLDKSAGWLVSKRVGKKAYLRRRGPLSGQTIQEKVPLNKVSLETLSERDFPRFSGMAGKLEGIFGGPQEAEWGVERGRIVLLQSKPISFSKAPAGEGRPQGMESIEPAYRGIGVSAGIASGKGILFIEGMAKPDSTGILVVKTMGMEILPYLRWFSGIVSEQGGSGSCLSSAARELGIPAVTGVENATILLAGKEIFLDGARGEICLK